MAVGVIKMSYDDFCRLAPQEFSCIYDAWAKQEETREKTEWERMRLLATITIQPHVKGHMRPEKLLPFPWERPKTIKGRQMSLEERRALMTELSKC